MTSRELGAPCPVWPPASNAPKRATESARRAARLFIPRFYSWASRLHGACADDHEAGAESDARHAEGERDQGRAIGSEPPHLDRVETAKPMRPHIVPAQDSSGLLASAMAPARTVNAPINPAKVRAFTPTRSA